LLIINQQPNQLIRISILRSKFEVAMSGIEQIRSVTAANTLSAGAGAVGAGATGAAPNQVTPPYANDLPDLPALGVPNTDVAKSVANDFTKVLETYRVKSERVDSAVNQARSGEMSGPPNQRDMIKQLGDLYTYAVDTQLLVRTAGQLTTGVRQLVTGQ
jgi:hypothetical protein